jgi:hypothetical protein
MKDEEWKKQVESRLADLEKRLATASSYIPPSALIPLTPGEHRIMLSYVQTCNQRETARQLGYGSPRYVHAVIRRPRCQQWLAAWNQYQDALVSRQSNLNAIQSALNL